MLLLHDHGDDDVSFMLDRFLEIKRGQMILALLWRHSPAVVYVGQFAINGGFYIVVVLAEIRPCILQYNFFSFIRPGLGCPVNLQLGQYKVAVIRRTPWPVFWQALVHERLNAKAGESRNCCPGDLELCEGGLGGLGGSTFAGCFIPFDTQIRLGLFLSYPDGGD